MLGLIMSTISGAGDTTATTITASIYYLLHQESDLERLLAELAGAGILGLPKHEQVRNLPFLNAVIKESLRIFAVLTWPMERAVPSGGVKITGTYFPESTSVGCMPAAVHMNTKVFGDDAAVFRPLRWLEADKDRLHRMEAAQIGFSRGRRACIGQHIATMQMRKVIPLLLTTFKVLSDLVEEVVFSLKSIVDESGRSAGIFRC